MGTLIEARRLLSMLWRGLFSGGLGADERLRFRKEQSAPGSWQSWSWRAKLIGPQAWLADVLARITAIPRVGFANCCHGIGAPMSGLSRRLKQLDEELLALGEETMLLEELDGFIAGLLVCPDLIKPGEWLPIVWNRNSADQ
jgi:hypothetical protein